MNDSFNIIDLLKILGKWRRAIIIITSISLVGSIVVSLLMPEYYKSQTTFYASNPALTDRQTLFNTQGRGESTIEYFGTKKDVDRVLSIAKSSYLSSYIIYKFDLFKHYDIDTANTKYYLTKVNKEFEANYSPIKTDLGGIEITILDTDPKMAADIANEIVRKIDEINKMMVLENKKKIIKMFNDEKERKEIRVSQLSDSLSSLRSLVKTNNGDNKISEKIQILKTRFDNTLDELNEISLLYEQHSLSTSEEISTLAVVEKAYSAEKKSKPIRWLIVVSSTFIALIFSIFCVIILEKYHQIKPELFNGD